MLYCTSRTTNTVFLKAAAALAAVVTTTVTFAESPPHHGHIMGNSAAPFVASTAKPFSALMHDAMNIMDDGMRRAPMSGVPEHDFVTMMIPHHQGAIDMAKGLLLYTKDPELINLAQGIITEQQNEIRLMEAWLKRHEQQRGARPPNK